MDARDIPRPLLAERQLVWFQCPWNPGQKGTDQLIRDFLMDLVGKTERGVHVCVGITKQFPYIQSYGLESILGRYLQAEENATEVLHHYNFLGADDELVRGILEFGYQHQGEKDIHHQIINDHVTLVFVRK